MKAPAYYQPIMPYLIVENATSFMAFVKEVFDADVKLAVPRQDGRIMHAEITIDNGTIMFADASVDYPPFPAGMFLYSPRAIAFYDKAVAKGAISIQEPAVQDYGLSAGFKDAWGNIWWVTVPGD